MWISRSSNQDDEYPTQKFPALDSFDLLGPEKKTKICI